MRAALAVALLCGLAVSAEPNSAGRRIYEQGRGSAPVLATLSDGLTVDASVLPCAGCHGLHGRQAPEGGIAPSDLTWAALSRPYALSTPTGRRHGPYTPESFIRALRMGVDPAGQPLHPVMPRYTLSDEDAQALADYVRTELGQAPEPGVTETELHVGVYLPDSAEGRAVLQALEEAAARFNAQGGAYGRRVRLVSTAHAPGGEALRAAQDQVFAWVAPYVAGDEATLLPLLDSGPAPVLGAITDSPRPSPDSHLFYVLGGQAEQLRALIDQAVRNGGPIALLVPEDPSARALIEAAEQQALLNRVTLERRPASLDPRQLMRELPELRNLVVLGEAPVSLRLALGGRITLLALGELNPSLAAGGDWSGRVILSYALPQDCAALDQGSPYLPQAHAAVAAFDLLGEALRASGRALRRQELMATLEASAGPWMGSAPTVRYDPNRRVGSRGACLRVLAPHSATWSTLSPWSETLGSAGPPRILH